VCELSIPVPQIIIPAGELQPGFLIRLGAPLRPKPEDIAHAGGRLGLQHAERVVLVGGEQVGGAAKPLANAALRVKGIERARAAGIAGKQTVGLPGVGRLQDGPGAVQLRDRLAAVVEVIRPPA